MRSSYENCLEAVIYRFEDGYVLCPILWSSGKCEECMEIFERRVENGAVGAETQGA